MRRTRCCCAGLLPSSMRMSRPTPSRRAAPRICAAARWRCGASPATAKAATPRSGSTTPTARPTAGRRPHTIVEIVNDDMPFLVDSVTAAINESGREVRLVIHPILTRGARRDRRARGARSAGRADSANPGCRSRSAASRRQPSAPRSQTRLAAVLADVRAGGRRLAAMRQALRGDRRRDRRRAAAAAAPARSPRASISCAGSTTTISPISAFANTCFAGAARAGATAARHPARSEPSGVRRTARSRGAAAGGAGFRPPPRAADRRQDRTAAPRCTDRRTWTRSASGASTPPARSSAVRLFVGLFTSLAYSRSPRAIPLLRHKVRRTLARAGLAPDSHDGKALLHILDTFPRDELFQIAEDELFDTALGILNLQERQRIALFVRRDPLERFVSCLVYVPRDRYDTRLRERFAAILERGVRRHRHRLLHACSTSRCWRASSSSSARPAAPCRAVDIGGARTAARRSGTHLDGPGRGGGRGGASAKWRRAPRLRRLQPLPGRLPGAHRRRRRRSPIWRGSRRCWPAPPLEASLHPPRSGRDARVCGSIRRDEPVVALGRAADPREPGAADRRRGAVPDRQRTDGTAVWIHEFTLAAGAVPTVAVRRRRARASRRRCVAIWTGARRE